MPLRRQKTTPSRSSIFQKAWLSIQAGFLAVWEFLKLGAYLVKNLWNALTGSSKKQVFSAKSAPQARKKVAWGTNTKRSIAYEEVNPPKHIKDAPQKGILKNAKKHSAPTRPSSPAKVTWVQNSEADITDVHPPAYPKPTPTKGILKKSSKG